jgi:phospholipid/cholesterol/gamma-HCH transport system substrate-binding protein
MASRRAGEPRVRPAWWTLIFIGLVVGVLVMTGMLFEGTLKPVVPVTMTSDRAGLVMESGGKVKLRGVQVGLVSQIAGGNDSVSLKLEIYPDQIKYIPANIQARIRATTAFGAKYVDLVYPSDPSPRRLAAGAVIRSQNVSIEVNTVFENLVGVLHQVDPQKLNGVLSALSEGLRDQGPAIGEATTDANQVLTALNQRADVIRADWKSFAGFSDTYGAAAHDILMVLDAATTTSATISNNSRALDALLTSVVGFSQSGIKLIGPAKDDLVNAVDVAEPTTGLLLKYNPELTCMLVGGLKALHNGDDGIWQTAGGANGKSLIIDTALLLGDDAYSYPDNLPIIGAKGGPGGKPSCGSLPDVAANFPQRYLVTNTGWGTGMDLRPNPGIGFPGYADYFPTTRAIPQPPSIRHPGGPAPGPIPYPGAPPYGAPMYAPDGTPLYPGDPPAPAPMAPRELGPPPPGTEPFVVPNPAQLQPVSAPPPPQEATPSP